MRDIHPTLFSLLTAVTLAAVALGLVACGVTEEDREPITTEQEGEEPVDVSPQEAETALERVALGTSVADDGSIAWEQQTTEFAIGDTVYVAFELDPESPATEVEVSWYGPDGLVIDSDQTVVEPDQGYVNFEIRTTALEPGTYRGEVWYGNELVEEFEFTVTAADDA